MTKLDSELRKKSQDFAVRYYQALEDDDYKLAEKLTLEHLALVSNREAKLLRKVKKIVKKPRDIWVTNDNKGEPIELYWDSLREQILSDLEELK